MLRESGVQGVTGPSSSTTASTLRHLLDETADLIDSPSFSYVLTLLNNEEFSTLIDQKCATDAFKPDSVGTVVAPSSLKTKLANLLAVLARQAHVIGNGTHPPNEYLNAMDQNVRELEAFSAVVYSSNFDLELLGAAKRTARHTADVADPESASSSSAPVMVDTEAEISSSAPVLVDNDPEEASAETEQPAPTATGPAPEYTFETAWGKAVEEGKSTP